MSADSTALARELIAAYRARRTDVVPPSSRDPGFSLTAGYAVEAAAVGIRRGEGHAVVGRKVGFANRAVWRVFKLETVAWASMYDDTVRHAAGGSAELAIGPMVAPKIEPEIIFKLARAPEGSREDPDAALAAVEAFGLGYEIVDCVYQDWKFQPADFVASLGLHAGLIVGPLLPVTPEAIPDLVLQLAECRATLRRNGEIVAEGGGRNVLKSPALCLAELAHGVTTTPGAAPLAPGELIASGALTDNQFMRPGETWTASLDGIELPDITLRTVS